MQQQRPQRPGLFMWLLGWGWWGVKLVFAPITTAVWFVKWGLYLVLAVGAAALILTLFGGGYLCLRVWRWIWPHPQPEEWPRLRPWPATSGPQVQLYKGWTEDEPG